MSRSKKPDPKAAKVSVLVLQTLADLQCTGKRVLFLAPSWSDDAFQCRTTVPAEPAYCFYPVPDYLLSAEVRLTDPAAAKHLPDAIQQLAEQGHIITQPMRLQEHDDFAYRRANGEVLHVQVSPLDGVATIRLHAAWPPRPNRPALRQGRIELARGDGQHLGGGCRITQAGLDRLAHPEPQPHRQAEPKPEAALTARQVADRYGVDVDAVYGWLRSGLLPSINVSAKSGSRKPRYLIRPQDLEQFEQVRATKAPAPERSRKRKDPTVEKFF